MMWIRYLSIKESQEPTFFFEANMTFHVLKAALKTPAMQQKT